MPRTQRSSVARLIEVFLLSIDKIGIQKTNKALKGEIKKNQSLNNSDATFIVSAVAAIMKITEEEIYGGTGRKNERVYAIGFCAYYLHYVYEYDMEEVQYMLRQKNEWVIYKYSLLIKELNPEHSSDKPFIQIKTLLDQRVKEHRKPRKKKVNNEKGNRAGAVAPNKQ